MRSDIRKRRDRSKYILIYLSAALSVSLLVVILIYVFVKGMGSISIGFLTQVKSALKGTRGIAGNILNTVYVVFITLLFASPIGIGSAIYLNEYAKPGKFVRLVEFTTQTLSGIPSILFGLFGMLFFGNVLNLGYSILTGCLTLTLMILPLIIGNTKEALKSVPDSYRQGAAGMGATKWYMIRTILLPSAMPGIVTGLILAVGRIVGESAALLFTAGSGYLLPASAQGYFNKIFESGGTLTIELYLSMSKADYETAFGIALVLLVIVFLINRLTRLIIRKHC
ncbi:MAG: phosphate ABC transporter permease PstA [Lachnospiraceae bacterium]